ncbi:hypothetical protein GF337_13400 [candidate division KSB1 bacterium]|nr:hypothetical protein [candidate division KSB1 bacterium]
MGGCKFASSPPNPASNVIRSPPPDKLPSSEPNAIWRAFSDLDSGVIHIRFGWRTHP